MSDKIKTELPFQTKNHVIIFLDWDDTLFPTTFIRQINATDISEMNEKQKILIEQLQDNVCTIINKSLQCGSVAIVTNAQEGWVESCIESYMSKLMFVIDKIKIISARSSFECYHPGVPILWKYRAFYMVLSNYVNNNIMKYPNIKKKLNVVSIGDSDIERLAITSTISLNYQHSLRKSIKLMLRPGMTELNLQQKLLIDNYDFIIGNKESLDLSISEINVPVKDAKKLNIE